MTEPRRHHEPPRPATPDERVRAEREGLYRSRTESDACGVGFVAQLRGGPTHAVIEQALTVLENLEHRGAAASDPLTGDGAGVLLQLPHALLEQECARLGFAPGAPGTYGVGMLFLPREPALAARLRALAERIVREEQQCVLGWREVPVAPEHAGPAARANRPRIEQLFVGPGTLAADDLALDRKLYVIRKRFESAVLAEGLRADDLPYVASLSTRTVVYKGLLTPYQLARFYKDLSDPRALSALAVLHQRFSTNTFPSWSRAHPYRRIAHNGEINTLTGNVRWMRAREPALRAAVFGEDVRKLLPVIDESGSDSAIFDDVLELLVHTGRSLPHAVMMMIPEAWQHHAQMPAEARAFYEYHACVMEPWDGPACVVFSDGRYVGAVLDRNGLRPARYAVTHDGLVVMASETGVLELPSERVAERNRVQPGRLFLVDTHEGRVVSDAEVRNKVVARRPWARWLGENRVRLSELEAPPGRAPMEERERTRLLRCFGYSNEDLRRVLAPMASAGEEPVGSMGNDSPPAALSAQPRLLFDYFRQRFAQVTNPPIDPLREALVMSLAQPLGYESNLFEESPAHCRKLWLDSPVLSDADLARLRSLDRDGLRARTLVATYASAGGVEALRDTLARLGAEAERAVREGCTLLVLSDRAVDETHAPVPSLLALGAVNRHLVEAGLRHGCGLVVETGEAREVMHLCLLIAYGAGAVVPYLAYEVGSPGTELEFAL